MAGCTDVRWPRKLTCHKEPHRSFVSLCVMIEIAEAALNLVATDWMAWITFFPTAVVFPFWVGSARIWDSPILPLSLLCGVHIVCFKHFKNALWDLRSFGCEIPRLLSSVTTDGGQCRIPWPEVSDKCSPCYSDGATCSNLTSRSHSFFLVGVSDIFDQKASCLILLRGFAQHLQRNPRILYLVSQD